MSIAVALVGAGRMGAAMGARLRSAGHRVVVYNRTRDRAEHFAAGTGAEVADTARAAAAVADVVVVSVADDRAVEAVHGGDDGILAGVRAGTVLIETSTVAAGTVRGLEPLVARRSAVLLDAPVSGSVVVAEAGELTFLVGGDPAAVDRVRLVLDILGRQVVHLGPVGAGSVMKLAVNSVLAALNQALAEALVLAERAGIDREAAYGAFAASAIAAPYVRYKRDAFERPETADVAFALRLVAKDLGLVDALAAETGARMEQLAANRRMVAEAVGAGMGDRDLSAIAELLRDHRTTGG